MHSRGGATGFGIFEDSPGRRAPNNRPHPGISFIFIGSLLQTGNLENLGKKPELPSRTTTKAFPGAVGHTIFTHNAENQAIS
jgi:hypothetical protein